MKQRHKKRDPERDVTYLPPHIGKAFQTDLETVVFGLPDNFRSSYLKGEFLSKYVELDASSADMRRTAAIKKWLATEKRNEVTNTRLMFGGVDFKWVEEELFIEFVRNLISKILGPLDTSTFFNGGTHTTGSSTRVSRGPTAHIEKHDGKAHVSSSALAYWRSFVENTRLEDQQLAIQESSVMFTVPKNADIDRVACKEPEINMFLQRRVGLFLKDRLKIFGIDLRDQSINQNLARVALKRNLGTIDLSSASDTITISLVMALLPADWWSLLDDLRVQYVTLDDGSLHRLQMFSSMGNGFTFELESLIFYALTRGIAYFSKKKGTISVFGDDIIAPQTLGPRIQRTFSWFGFTVNHKKSNWSGPFRESCGKHYIDGIDVSPFYLREPIRSKTDIIHMLNSILKWDSYGSLVFNTPEIARFCYRWRTVIPQKLWGGQDPDDITSLVTGHAPRYRLVPVTRPVEYNSSAGLEFWFTKAILGDGPFFSNKPIGWKRGRLRKFCFTAGFSVPCTNDPQKGRRIEPVRELRYRFSEVSLNSWDRCELMTWDLIENLRPCCHADCDN